MAGRRQSTDCAPSACPATGRPRELTSSELWMCRTAATGGVADFGARYGRADVANADGWGAERSLRAEVIRDLLLDAVDGHRLQAKGLRIDGARIVGQLDCEDISLEYVLVLRNCRFEEAPILERASVPHLDLTGSCLPGLRAKALSVNHDVVLAKIVSHGEVAMESVDIGGELNCGGASFVNAHGVALGLRGGRVKQAASFRRPFNARGSMNLRRAHLGALDLDGADIANEHGPALDGPSVTVDGPTLLRDAFKARGEVRLLAARLGAGLVARQP
jgi:hypothetical protein